MHLSRRTRSTTRRTWRIQGWQSERHKEPKHLLFLLPSPAHADIFENNPGLRVYPSHVTISFGKPFKFSDLPAAEKKFAGEHVKKAIEDMLATQQ